MNTLNTVFYLILIHSSYYHSKWSLFMHSHRTWSLILSLKSHGLPPSVCIFEIDLMTWFVSLNHVTYIHIHLDWLHSAFENIMSLLCLRFAAFSDLFYSDFLGDRL